MNPSERAILRERMTEEELAPWRPFAWEDLKQKIASRFAELTEDEKADTKRCPLGAGPENQKKEKEQYPWIAVPDDLMEKIASRLAEWSEDEKSDPKCHPLEAGPKNQKNENERKPGGPWSEENSSKFILRKNGYIIKDKQVTPPNPLPERFLFSEEAMCRIVLRKLGYTFTDEILY